MIRQITGNTAQLKVGDRLSYTFDNGETLSGYVADIRIVPGFTSRIVRATLRFYNRPYRIADACPDTLMQSISNLQRC